MKKTFKQFLSETPLPSDWDKNVYAKNNSFAKKLKYAKERAATVGSGSGRAAFKIEHEGRPTVLKIAKNRKGLAQNEHESQMMRDYYITGLGLVIPMIDCDDNDQPVWIHTEFAQKAKSSDFTKHFGCSLQDLVAYASKHKGTPFFGGNPENVDPNNEHVVDFVDFAHNYDLPLGDFSRKANWGVYEGRPVIVDVGLSQDVYDLHYSGKPSKREW